MYDILALYCKGTTMLFSYIKESGKNHEENDETKQKRRTTRSKTRPRRRKQQTHTTRPKRPKTTTDPGNQNETDNRPDRPATNTEKQKKSKGLQPQRVTNPNAGLPTVTSPRRSPRRFGGAKPPLNFRYGLRYNGGVSKSIQKFKIFLDILTAMMGEYPKISIFSVF